MEPGHEDREYSAGGTTQDDIELPQWSPVMKTGNTAGQDGRRGRVDVASMEPGHEDREYSSTQASRSWQILPQWSPVMKTGNTYRYREIAEAVG